MKLKDRAKKTYDLLLKEYPDAKTALNFSTPLQLLVATILSAQCTDERVNIVTPGLFRKYAGPDAFANADQAALEQEIRSTGFFRNKAKNIIACCRDIVEKHGGRVPSNMEALILLPGIGRKTANVILGNVFGIPGIVVDTHVIRLSGRIGLSRETDPVKIEFDLMKIVDRKNWTMFSHLLVFHGRNICRARKPACYKCGIAKICSYTGKTAKP
ncbi:MAG: endonuclease III [Candidatus Aureabacteria bacterium]|nr:endonuclease III [Candidatus Auribacterota bacterium]